MGSEWKEGFEPMNERVEDQAPNCDFQSVVADRRVVEDYGKCTFADDKRSPSSKLLKERAWIREEPENEGM